MRPVDKGSWPTYRAGKKYIFNDWRKAKKHLLSRTGGFCHFCEMRINNALAVEHIKPRDSHPRLSNSWNNFLLSCNSCNSSKRQTAPLSPYRQRYYWPHLNNTMLAFYTPLIGTGAMVINAATTLSVEQKVKAQATIKLYGLDKLKTSTGDSDNRFTERLETIDMAIELLRDYTNNETNIGSILKVAESRGFFSIWIDIFRSKPEVVTALIDSPKFKINRAICFDLNLQPIPRNALKSDPI